MISTNSIQNLSNSPVPKLELNASRQFTAWLFEQHLSLTFSTYQGGKIFFIGLQPSGKLSVFERTFERCMGLHATENTIWLSSLYQMWRLDNILDPGQQQDGYDCLYVPQMSYITGDLDIHDLALNNQQQPIFVNTLFNCLATVSPSHSFQPLWKPPFISRLAAEDRCHLNGMAMVEGKPKYVTAVSQSDVVDGWRDKRTNSGCVIDVETNEIVVTGLSMPHSPRWYQGKLWLLNSGTGELGYGDLQTSTFVPVSFCPGYLRGLAFAGDYAIVGLSKPRDNKTFTGLPLDERLQEKDVAPRCGLIVIDLRTGDCVHSLQIEGVVEELYDVAVIPQRRCPMVIGIKSDEIRRILRITE
ncbi:TIGR03032 family protein [Waterburya agarophytonicola K14]|uniref:TIGR03032 family protein n=1 Tax=Waterburya agarophytonicola KI4 TaxID=2874699 RepID=A0A964BST0_9CYAN|nr:TIGR03032 family protein [Waterburya agarophytonicola]MCC0177571.1 TIGR03032 family protein [Waterburya agarophytonicola KI4]